MILFYILFFVGISSAIFVLTSNNMIYSTLSLIIVFISSSLLMLLLKADFLGYLFIIVYVGAVSILFLFVVMNLSIQEDEFLYTSQSKNNFLDKLLFILFF
jgi:NADH-quinone oxidoreductase subunit J